MPDISRYLKKAKQMDAENGVVYTATPHTSSNRSTYTPSQSGPDISRYLEKARAMDGGGYGTAPTVTADRRRISDVPGDYDVNIGKSGWQKYLADQERKRSEAMAAQKEKSFWEKLAGYLGEVQDTTMSLSGMPSIIEDYREDTSYLQPNDEWMDEERYVFGYLYDTDRTAAYQYADKVNAAINAEKEAAQAQKVMDRATNGFWGGAANTVGAILTAPLGLADYLDDLAQTSARGEIRDNGVMSPFEYSQNVTVGISQDLNEKYGTLNENIPVIGGKGWGDVYGLGTSIAQSALAGYTGGGGQALVQFFGSAAAASVDDALSRGATAEQAVIVGTASGVAEGLMENIGVENLLKIGSSATMRELVINLAKQGVIESLEEGGTSLLNNIADQLVMQDKSNFFILAKNYMDNGWSEEEAKRQAWLDMAEDIAYDMLGGFVSGAVHAGPQTVYHTISQNAQAKNTYGDSTHELVAEGLASAEGSLSRTLAEKYQAKLNSGGNLTGAEIHRLVIANEQQFYSEDMDAIKQAAENRLVELGEFEKASDVAAVLAKLAAKQKLTAAEKAIVQNSKYGQRVANEMNPSNIRSGGFESGWAKSIGTNTINYAEYNADLMSLAGDVAGVSTSSPVSASKESAPNAGSLTPAAVAPATERFTASESGKLTNKKTGADLGKVEITSSDGKSLKLKTESGEIVDAKDVNFRSKDEAMVYSAVLDMGVSPVVAQSIVDNFDGTDGRVYAADVKLAYQYGKMNFPKSYLDKLDIKPHQAEHAYNLGRSDAKAEAVAPKTKRTVNGKRGTVIFETAVDESALTPIQKASLNGIKAIADMSGLNVHVFESRLTKDGYKFTLPDGTVTGANGWYVTGTNDIWIDMNAGNAGEGTMLYTAAHEISHFIKEWSPTKWRVLADFLLEQYGEDVPLDALLERQMAKVRKNNPDLQGNALMDAAYEELVSDAMSEMLVDGEVVQKLAELKQKDKTLWEKIKDAIRDLLEKWGLIRKEYEGRSVAGEAEFLRGMDEAFKKLQQLYTEAFAEASENFAAAADEVLQSGAKPVTTGEIVTDGAVVVDGKGNKYSIRSMKADIAEGKMFDDLMKYCGWSRARVNELRKQLTDLVAYMEPNRDILDMNETYGREGRKFSPYKPNSDPLYQISMDFSTLCSKRLLTQYVIENLQLRENRPMSAEEQMAIRDMLIEYRQVEKGLQVACAMCYVEAARLKSPKQMQRWLDDPAPLLRDYFGKANKAFNDSVKEAQADFKESRGYARNAPKKEMSAADVRELNKIGPRMRAQYQLSEEEMQIVERAKSLPNSTYLTAGNLASLSETDPVIYRAYTSFVRTATRSKSLETDEPYYYGDSTRDNGNGIIVSDSFIEAVNRENGMRFSSWSDWRIQHLLDYITAVIDNSVRGAAMHGYTKFSEEVRVLGKTGMMFNLSGVAGTQTGLNPDGSLNFSPTESIDINDAIELREEFPETAGLQCIGVSDEHVFALLRSDIIDYVIPYHVSGLNAGLRRMADIYGWNDYTSTQHAVIDSSVKHNGQEHWHEEPVFSEFFVGYDTGMTGEEAMQESARRYVEMCRERGLTPKFEKFAKEPGYWKLLVDRKMINQKTGELIRQKPVTPTFDFDAIKAVVDRHVENYDSGMEARALSHIVKNWDSVPGRIRELKKRGTKKAKAQKALDTLHNEMMAAQPKTSEVKRSERDADGDYDIKNSDRDDLTYAEITEKQRELYQREMNLAERKREANSNPEILQAMDAFHGLSDEMHDLLQKRRQGTATQEDLDRIEEIKVLRDVKLQQVVEIQERLGLKAMEAEDAEIRQMKEDLRVAADAAWKREGAERESAAISKAGVSAPEYFRKKALKSFKTTTNFNEAGYLLPDGKLLNFSGGERNHRYRDHREIGEIYEATQGAAALNRFMSDGNIRIMAESPGVDITSGVEPTKEQYDAIRRFVNANGVKSGKFFVDFSDAEGHRAGNYFYEGRVSADRVINDIKHFYATGEIREQSAVAQFRYSDRDIDSVSNRDILANAFMDIAQDDVERGKIAEYQQKIKALDEDERKLRDIRAQLHDLSFSAGPRDNAKIRELREKATKLANSIGIQDKQLLRLEASKPLMAVLEREKKLAYSRASQKWEDRIETARTGRSKTEMRHKIKKIVGELNNLLLHGTKDKHIMIGLQKATAEALSAINMDTVAAEKRLAKIQAKIDKATDPAEKARLQQSYARVEAMGDNMATRLTALKNAYEEIKDSSDPLVANAYQPEIEERIKNLRKMVGDTPLRNMSMEQLEFTYDTYKMVLTTIRNANKAFKNERGESIAVLGNRSMEEIGRVGGKKELVASAMRGPLGFAWSGMKPTYAFKAIGSDTLSEMFSQVRAGEDVWATDVNEAKEFYSQKTKQYNYDSWDLEKEYTFTSKSGKEFKLTLEQIMSLYAYSKRKQADAHLDKGGFVFDSSIEVVKRSKLGIPVKYRVNTAHAHALSRDTLMEICKTLTDEQVKFVDEMQDYLSVMGEKGNEVSLKMYGVKIFKEKFYFPLKSAKQFMYEQYEVAGDRKIKNSGFSKDTTPHASNPVILSNFTDVWATHVNDMAMYHAFVLPMEDFERVFNYKTPTSDTMPTESVKGYLQDAYGVHPEQYIKQLMTDLNGGARIDPTAGIINKGIALFKKSAVFASLSVVIQQPSAIARAMSYIDAKYFVGKPGLKDWDEVKKYAPVAIIKEMGYFDTNMGKSTVEFIKAKEYTGVKSKMKALVTDRQYRDEILSKAPSVADELAWCQIWNAVKKEIAETKKLQGEELLQAAGKRFTEVIVNTQVYDSVLTRSGMMRSKDTGMKMATSFMAEPTTSLNMIADALIQGKRGNKGYARKAIGAVAASMILNSILVSFVYAGRDDDEDKTYIEKYAGSLTSELIDSFNPLTLIPFVKDIVSIAQGYDVERSDMAVITDLFNAWKKLSSDNLSVYRKVEGFGGTIASIFGLPLKNIMRDVRGIYNTVKSAVAGPDTTGRGVLDASRESLPKWMGGGERSNADQLYAAMLSGDTGHVERLKARFKDDRAFTYAVRDGLVNNDKRITAAAEARAAGNQTEYMRLAREIVNEGHFSQDDVVRAVNYVLNSLTKKESEPAEATKPETFKIDEYLSEALSGDQAEAELVKREIIAGHVADGKTEDEALKSFNNSFKNNAVKGAFTDGDITMDVAISMLQQYGGMEPDDAYADVQYWQFKQNHPDIYVVNSWFDSYYEYASDAGIGIDVYMQYRNDVKNITGEGKKERRMAAINALPLSPAQKDALYFDEGWVASKLYEAPWR